MLVLRVGLQSVDNKEAEGSGGCYDSDVGPLYYDRIKSSSVDLDVFCSRSLCLQV